MHTETICKYKQKPLTVCECAHMKHWRSNMNIYQSKLLIDSLLKCDEEQIGRWRAGGGDNLRKTELYYAKPSAKVKHVAKPVYVLSDLWASSQVCVCARTFGCHNCVCTGVFALHCHDSLCVCAFKTWEECEAPHKIYYLYFSIYWRDPEKSF